MWDSPCTKTFIDPNVFRTGGLLFLYQSTSSESSILAALSFCKRYKSKQIQHSNITRIENGGAMKDESKIDFKN